MNYQNILQTIGNTPIVELKKYSPSNKVKILAKLEGNNPGGSVKDRIALYMINQAEKESLLDSKKVILEATSGNTGIGLAMISAIRGYRFLALMPESASLERRKLMKAYGAKIQLTDGVKGTNHTIKVAKQMVKKNPEKYVMLDQFNNQANVRAHYQTTGKEIIKQAPNITHFVAGMGTGGTLMGVGQRLKETNSEIKVVGVEPIAGSKIQGIRNMKAYTPSIFKPEKLDQSLLVKKDQQVFNLARDLFKKEGISVGISSGAALWGAIQVANSIEKGVIVTLFPDRGDKYLTTDLFN